jgi:hypothetical protein
MDGRTAIDLPSFYRIMLRLVPDLHRFPWDVLPWSPRVSLGIFVHRIRGLEPGLYLLARTAQHRESLRKTLSRPFLWRVPRECPPSLA